MFGMGKKVVTRVAPSPTGFFHVGTARTALFNYLYARKHGGKFIMRVEDTDKERSQAVYEESIIDGLKWLGLEYDFSAKQSERTEIYKKYLQRLIESGKAYISKEEEREGMRSEVIRLKNLGQKVSFDDEIRGNISFDTKELGDFVIAKSIDEPLYHLAVVVDDHEMEVTHVIRGEDHISNTPRQILIIEALGFERPIYAHLPLILAPDRSKLSKRNGAVSLADYQNEGYLPETMVNFLALLGWSPQGKNDNAEEILSLKELVEKFDLSKVGKGGAIFNKEKLDWLNHEYIKNLPKEVLLKNVKNNIPKYIVSLPEWSEERLHKIIPILIERIVKFSDVVKMAEEGDLDYYFKAPLCNPSLLIWKKDEGGVLIRKEIVNLINTLEAIPESHFDSEHLKNAIMELIGTQDKGSYLWPLRYSLSGKERSPDPFTLSAIIGKESTLSRLKKAASLLQG